MSYGIPRKAKLKLPLTAKVIGTGTTRDYRAGKQCQVQRNPTNPSMFIIWFSKSDIAQVTADDMPSTIEYIDGKPDHWQ